MAAHIDFATLMDQAEAARATMKDAEAKLAEARDMVDLARAVACARGQTVASPHERRPHAEFDEGESTGTTTHRPVGRVSFGLPFNSLVSPATRNGECLRRLVRLSACTHTPQQRGHRRRRLHSVGGNALTSNVVSTGVPPHTYVILSFSATAAGERYERDARCREGDQ